MLSAWLLPEHIADVLPAQARQVEDLRTDLLNAARRYGYELVMPPLLEHLDSLLTGTGRELGLQTFKLVDQLSGRTLGLRADTTPQAARIDAHLLNRKGLVRLCYCGPVLHTLPAGALATREPLQFGAELFGHAGLEADLEVLELALDCLRLAGIGQVTVDIADARIAHALLAGLPAADAPDVLDALASKDPAALAAALVCCSESHRSGLMALGGLYGGRDILAMARRQLPPLPAIHAALDDLAALSRHTEEAHPEVVVGFDLGDVGRYAYYSGARFTVYVPGCSEAIARGGRYDEVGAIFGRKRPAVGFSLDVKELAQLQSPRVPPSAILAPSGDTPALRAAVRRLREQGETVACLLPGHDDEVQEFSCDRALVETGAGRWEVQQVRAMQSVAQR